MIAETNWLLPDDYEEAVEGTWSPTEPLLKRGSGSLRVDMVVHDETGLCEFRALFNKPEDWN